MSASRAIGTIVTLFAVAGGVVTGAYVTELGPFATGGHPQSGPKSPATGGPPTPPQPTPPVPPSSPTGAPTATPPTQPATPATPATPTAPAPSPPAKPTPTAQPSPPVKPTPPPAILAAEDRGDRVREVEARLAQLKLLDTRWVDGYYGTTTTVAVTGFQRAHGLPALGYVDAATLTALNRLTHPPTQAELHPAPPAIAAYGDRGDQVRDIEARLVQLRLLDRQWVDGYFGTTTTDAIRSYQSRHGLRVLGYVDAATLTSLRAATRTPTHDELYPPKPPATGGDLKLDPRCLTGRVICIDKSQRVLRWVVDGKVQQTLAARFGCPATPTREGVFQVFAKVRAGYSTLYDSSMPFSMFFSGGQAVHYSSDFAARGYAGCSHGCVNIRDYGGIAQLFDIVRIGEKVVVYRS